MSENNALIPGFDDAKDDGLAVSLSKIDSLPNGILVSLDGFIDTYNTAFLQAQVQKIIDANFARVVFDCSRLSYISSTGIGALTAFLKALRAKNGGMALAAPQSKVLEVFDLLGFSQFFNVFPNAREAELFLREGGSSPQAFPKIIACPVCAKQLKAARAGRFRCSQCSAIISIDDGGAVALG